MAGAVDNLLLTAGRGSVLKARSFLRNTNIRHAITETPRMQERADALLLPKYECDLVPLGGSPAVPGIVGQGVCTFSALSSPHTPALWNFQLKGAGQGTVLGYADVRKITSPTSLIATKRARDPFRRSQFHSCELSRLPHLEITTLITSYSRLHPEM